MTCEVNFDGLVGPTHNYGGLSFGNIASQKNKNILSAPRKAALQGLKKMKYLMDKGIIQGVLPPQPRPAFSIFREIGYSGSDQEILKEISLNNPILLLQGSSASAMWVANAATISPSSDTKDNKVHFTPANLVSNFHRSIEVPYTTKILRFIFSNKKHFVVHYPLPQCSQYSDEGAANFCRLASEHGKKGVEVLVYGKSCDSEEYMKFPARQTAEANEAICRRHGLDENFFFNLKQNPKVIDKGVFHNDVISVANENVFLYHEHAFANKAAFKTLQKKTEDALQCEIHFLMVKNEDLSVDESIKTYLFNSQLITIAKDKMLLLAPEECRKSKKVQRVLDKILQASNPIQEIKYFDLRESMRNGGGPACLRLRVVLTDKELAALSGRVILSDNLYQDLVHWVNSYYRTKLYPKDLTDFNLYKTNQEAQSELLKLLKIKI